MGRGTRHAAGMVVSGCSTGAMFVSSVRSGERIHTLEAARDSVWVLQSLLGSPDPTGARTFVVAAASRGSLGSVHCGTVAADGAVVNGNAGGGSAMPVQVLQGHSMALLCMDMTWLQAGEAWPGAGSSTPYEAGADSGMAVVALGGAGVARAHVQLLHAQGLPVTPRRALLVCGRHVRQPVEMCGGAVGWRGCR